MVLLVVFLIMMLERRTREDMKHKQRLGDDVLRVLLIFFVGCHGRVSCNETISRLGGGPEASCRIWSSGFSTAAE